MSDTPKHVLDAAKLIALNSGDYLETQHAIHVLDDMARILEEGQGRECAAEVAARIVARENERLEAELAALREQKNHWENAVRSCVEWSNGRESEWGERAEHAFKFLHYAINAARKEAQP